MVCWLVVELALGKPRDPCVNVTRNGLHLGMVMTLALAGLCAYYYIIFVI